MVCLPTGSENDVRTGKILENNPLYDWVRVECPPANGKPAGIFLVSRKDIKTGSITIGGNSLSSASPAANPTTPQPQVPAFGSQILAQNTPPAASQQSPVSNAPPASQNNQSAQNAKCACPPQTQANGNSIEDQIKRVIMSKYVMDGHALDALHTPSTVHINSFQIVKKRPYAMPIPGAYHTGSPDGPGGRMGTEVYEVLCKYTVCIDYPASTYTSYRGRVELVDHDAGFTCFIDTQGSWRCNQSKDSMTTKSIDK